MSAAALFVVLSHLLSFGVSPEMHAGRPDEGPTAHIWQIMMTGQIPIIPYFAIRWLRSDPLGTLSVIGFQVLAFVSAAAPVFARTPAALPNRSRDRVRSSAVRLSL